MTDQQYEFTAAQNVVFGGAAKWMGAMGWIMLVLGAVLALPVMAGYYLILPAAVFLVLAGMFTIRASRSFGLVTTTDGNDIDHVVDAVDNLRRLYRLQAAVILLAVGIAGVIAFLGYLET